MKTRISILALLATLVVVPAAPATAAAGESADGKRTRTVASYDPRSSVRAAAWGALVSSDVDAAVARFIATGHRFAISRAALNDARNTDFAQRVLATHTAEFAPEVHAAAEWALANGVAAREAFARSGYAAAKVRDRRAREDAGAAVAALVETDRAFVALLRDHDPGAQVRASATFALRPAATDADLVEFFAHDWPNAARLDLDAFRIQVGDEDMRWRAGVAGLLAAARSAEAAAAGLADEAAVQARAAAARAWSGVAAQTTTPQVVWAGAQQTAEAQAAHWRNVAQVAGAATGLHWAAVTGSAGATAESWAGEQQQADEQAAYWAGLLAEAVAGEQRMGGAA